MGSETGLIQYKNKTDYLAKKPALPKAALPNTPASTPLPKAEATPIDKAATKTNLSEQAKDTAKKVIDAAAKLPPTPPLSVVTDLVPDLIPDVVSEDEAQEVAEVVEEKPVEKIERVETIKDRPAIIFIKGLSLSSSSGDGLEDMASAIPKSEVYSWSEKDEVVESILKRPRTQPVILIGHSLGSDTAVEVAQELNKIEYGFRKVDLLVTLDSVGFNNDIISQNVKTNLNFIGDDWYGVNDSPNIARNTDYTNVINELRGDTHRGIENSEEVQLKVFERIDALLKGAVAQKMSTKLSIEAHKDLKGHSLQ